MATKGRRATRAARPAGVSRGGRRGGSAGRARSASGGPLLTLQREVARSLVALAILVVAGIVGIALIAPEAPILRLLADQLGPAFGVGAWLLPVVLFLAVLAIELRPARGGGWGGSVIGGLISFVAALGLLELTAGGGGGSLGETVSGVLAGPLGPLGAAIVLVGVLLGGVLLLAEMQLGELVRLVARPWGNLVALGGGGTVDEVDAESDTASADGGRRGATDAGRGAGRDRRGARGAPGAASGTLWEATHSVPPPIPTPQPMPIAPLSPEESAAPSATRAAAGAMGESQAAARPDYRLPPITLLDPDAPGISGGKMDHARNAEIIVAKLSAFDIPARVTRWNAGPVVTQYEVEPDPSIKVSRIEAVADDLAMALAARTIRVEAPIPGKTVVGVEIPNADFNVVSLRRVIEETRLLESPSRLTFALGRDVAGHARAADLGKMPHLLIAGATGSGKSVMVNALIVSLLAAATPDEVRLILMDLKRVELAAYNGLPHLLVPVITEPAAARAAFKWTVAEMEHRFRQFAEAKVRNLAAYNESRADPLDRLPTIVIVVDELADLMMREGRAVEDPIVRLAQKARAVGIHMVLATQRPSVNVVTGLIKANFPSRIAFAMASQIDSRTILDTPGAEDLIGRGDMLYQPSDLPRPMRLQGVFVSDREIGRLTEHWRAEGQPRYDMAIVETDEDGGEPEEGPDEEADRLLPDAIGVIREYDRASASLLQRRLRIGYARAARIIDQLEARGYVGPFDGSNARAVLRRDATAPRREPAYDDEGAEA